MFAVVAIFCTSILTNLADVASAIAEGQTNTAFDVAGTLLTISHTKTALFVLQTKEKNVIFRDVTNSRRIHSFAPGSHIRARGRISFNEYGYPAANSHELLFLEPGPRPKVTEISAASLTSDTIHGGLIRVRGTVRNIFRDEIDPKYIYMTLVDQSHTTFSVSLCDDGEQDAFAHSLLDAEIAVICAGFTRIGLRRISNLMLTTYDIDNIKVLIPAPSDPFSVPALASTDPLTPAEVAAMGRQKVSGRVIATRRGKDFVLVDDRGSFRRIRPRQPTYPAYGDLVDAVGYPETDLYRLNLGNAVWRKTGESSAGDDEPQNLQAASILSDTNGNFKINPLIHGKAIRLIGNVIDLPSRIEQAEIVSLKCDDFMIPVDVSSQPLLLESLTIGCRLAASGVCLVETDDWSSNQIFPRTRGITLVVRKPADIQILERPSWWTPMKMAIVAFTLLVTLFVFIVWNRVLNKLVVKRSRALFKEQLALAEAELKIGERTRLAIELHDSLSQNLAAVACQIAATKSAVKISAQETMTTLNAAEGMLLSCRTELRRCLWDLRNDTLDEQNMTEVVKKVLAPILDESQLSVRFNVSRDKFNDTTAHAVICIVRELAANAIRHGHASHIQVAGDLTDGEVSFSVMDDGQGFDVLRCPSASDGHFGLEGIRERVDRLRGTLQLRSEPGKGCYAKITIPLPNQNLED